MSSHKTCHLSKTGLWVSFSQWLSLLITNSLSDFYTYREWFLPTTTPLETVTPTQQNEYTHLQLSFQTGNISQNSHTPTPAQQNEYTHLQLSFQTGRHQSEFTHTYTYAAKWIHPPAVKLSNWTTSVRIHTHLHLRSKMNTPTCS